MDKYRKEILDLLNPLHFEKQLLFGALICEKLYPNYSKFCQYEPYDNSQILQEAISVIFQCVFNRELYSSSEIQDIINQVEIVTPDTENYETILVSFALDSCTSILSCLYFIQDNDVENIADVATYARDTIDMFIQERDNLSLNDSFLEQKIENDNLMQQEKRRQKIVLELLKSNKNINESLIQNLRNIQPDSIINLTNI
eukprot:GDKJ01004903.1.p2 GENE.GDKJ01004903.1~~GDKJ01004903.1.p2  ORF type:complete len:200 (-),score=6.39 GDKJ01004903.1:143-742(-)